MPDPTLQATALRYAAGDLAPGESAEFETRLAEDQDARDALAEAVRLSAQAIGQKPPAPHPSLRTAIRARLNLRVYRGHRLAWAAAGAAAVAACTLLDLSPGDRAEPQSARAPSVARAGRPPLPPAAPVQPDAPRPTAVAPRPHDARLPVAAHHAAHHSSMLAQVSLREEQRSVAEVWADLSGCENMEKARDDELRWRQRIRERSNPHHVSASAKAAEMADVSEP